MILVLYVSVAASWLLVGLFCMPAVISIFTGTRCYGDGARLMVLGWSLLMLGFVGRRIVMDRDADPAIVALMLFSIVTAFLTWRTAKGYGRGWRI